jgi:uncharacterized membrane protein
MQPDRTRESIAFISKFPCFSTCDSIVELADSYAIKVTRDSMTVTMAHTNDSRWFMRNLLHRGFIAAGAVLLIAAFATDSMYYETTLWQWANFSAWLIVFGLLVLLAGVMVLGVDFASGRAARLDRRSFGLVALAALLSLVNAFVHSRDAWTSVVPQGIGLSLISTILLLIAAARGWALAQVRAIGERP